MFVQFLGNQQVKQACRRGCLQLSGKKKRQTRKQDRNQSYNTDQALQIYAINMHVCMLKQKILTSEFAKASKEFCTD